MPGLALHSLNQRVLGLFGRHAGDLLQSGSLRIRSLGNLLLFLNQGLFFNADRLLLLEQVHLLLVHQDRLFVQMLFLLLYPLLLVLDIPLLFLQFTFCYFFCFKSCVLGCQLRFFGNGFRFPAGIL